jgi:hypothetical protein
MKHSVWIAACLWCSLNASGAEPKQIAMTPANWKTTGGAEFVKHKGIDSIALKPFDLKTWVPTGEAIAQNVSLRNFRNGTIEFDMEPLQMGAGIFFHRNQDTAEYIYLRPSPGCEASKDCIQYAPVLHGIELWDMYPQYQSGSPLHPDDWNHVKVVISGLRMNMFLNHGAQPALEIGMLESGAKEGEIWFEGPAFLANVTIVPGAVEGLPAEAVKDPAAGDPRYVRNWNVAKCGTPRLSVVSGPAFHSMSADKIPKLAEAPQSSADWQPVTAERGGMVNVSRVYGLPLPRNDRAAVWLKTSIASGKDQTKKVSIGWVREVWVFVNGQLVYSDKNLFQPPTARKAPDGRCAIENGSFDLPLKAGDNEITVALESNFYGWGLILRLDDIDGIRLPGK